MSEPEFKIVSMPMLDTGIGIEAGYASDAELIEAAKAERAAMPPEIREMADEIDRKFEERVLFGKVDAVAIAEP